MGGSGQGGRRLGGRVPIVAAGAVVLLVVVAAMVAGGGDGDGQVAATTTSSAAPSGSSTGPPASATSRPSDQVTTLPPATTTTGPPTTAPATTVPSPTTTVVAGDAAAARAALASLPVRTTDQAATPYRRDAFMDDWDYDPASGCNTRERVLIEESTIAPTVDDRCRTTVGRWTSSYDGVVTSDPADLQIDHLVALADAWRSGADRWTPERRHRFANDLTSPDTLIAVTGRTNESKSDSSPDEWLPPDRSSWCGYAEAWVRVKARWQLSVTAAEADRLGELLAAC